MPKPTAIMLSWSTIPRISDVLRIPEKKLEQEWYDMVVTDNNRTRTFYVKDASYRGIRQTYLIYEERSFLENFASVPPGIEEYFVPVTQVKD